MTVELKITDGSLTIADGIYGGIHTTVTTEDPDVFAEFPKLVERSDINKVLYRV